MTSHRKARMEDLLHTFLAEEIHRFRDPRMSLLTITAVDIAPDMKSARIYWTIPADRLTNDSPNAEATPGKETDPLASAFPSKSKVDEVQKALEGTVGLLKKRVGEELQLRYTPALLFKYDESIERAARIDYLLQKAQRG